MGKGNCTNKELPRLVVGRGIVAGSSASAVFVRMPDTQEKDVGPEAPSDKDITISSQLNNTLDLRRISSHSIYTSLVMSLYLGAP